MASKRDKKNVLKAVPAPSEKRKRWSQISRDLPRAAEGMSRETLEDILVELKSTGDVSLRRGWWQRTRQGEMTLRGLAGA